MSDEYIRLAAIRDYWVKHDLNAKIEIRVTDIDGVLNEIERLRVDAERYRWLREGRRWPACFRDHDDPEPCCAEELDEMIDEAMREARDDTR